MAAKLIIVDDDLDDIFVLNEVFSSTDYGKEVQFFQKSKELLPYLDSLEDKDLPQLIISDLHMPGYSGFDLLKKLKSNLRYQHIPFILCSTSTLTSDREKGIALGARDFLQKPMEQNGYSKMVERVEQLLRNGIPQSVSK
jgi:CheY-like chemotaxis protein